MEEYHLTLQTIKRCLVCKTTIGLHKHHIYENPYRKASDRAGMWVWLCMDHHTGDNGVHTHPEMDDKLHRVGQKMWEKKYSRESFIKTFGRNYL